MYYCWSDVNCFFVSEYLSKDIQSCAKTCSAVNVLPCQARLSLVEHACLCYVHAPTLYFQLSIHTEEYMLTFLLFDFLQILKLLAPISRWFNTVLLVTILSESLKVKTPGKI